ncbi:MAG: SurA N-terminal domain-containing protein [Chloroflexi bacterium]|nr:SurA N-terminal domain-containing protein [Chloroflexota bacterium]
MADQTGDPTKRDDSQSRRAGRREAQRKAKQSAQEIREERSADSDSAGRRLIIGGVVVVILIAVGIIAYGLYDTQIRPLNKTVLRVEDLEFSLAHLERRMRLESEANAFYTSSIDNLRLLPDVVINQLTAEAAILTGGSELNLTVDDEDVAGAVRVRGNLAPEVEATVFADEFRRQVDESGLKRSEYEQMLRANVMGEKAREYFQFISPQEEPQVRASIISVNDEAEADRALELLASGEDFTTVAVMVDADPASLELDWFPRAGSPQAVSEVEDFLFDAETDVGSRSEIISTFGFFFIAELLERDDAHPLDESQRLSVAEREFTAWVVDLRERLDIEQNFTTEDAIRAINDTF